MFISHSLSELCLTFNTITTEVSEMMFSVEIIAMQVQ